MTTSWLGMVAIVLIGAKIRYMYYSRGLDQVWLGMVAIVLIGAKIRYM